MRRSKQTWGTGHKKNDFQLKPQLRGGTTHVRSHPPLGEKQPERNRAAGVCWWAAARGEGVEAGGWQGTSPPGTAMPAPWGRWCF